MLSHTLKRLGAEYEAVRRAVRDGQIKIPDPHLTTGSKGKPALHVLQVDGILGTGRTWPLMVTKNGGIAAYTLATPKDIVLAHVRDGTNIIQQLQLAAVSVVVYGVIAILLSAGPFGPVVVAMPAILIDVYLLLMLAPFMGTRAPDGTRAWTLLNAQVSQSWLAQASIWSSLVGATLAAGLPAILAVLFGIAGITRIKRMESLRTQIGDKVVLFDQTLKTGVVAAVIVTLLIGGLVLTTPRGDFDLGFSLIRLQGLSSIALFVVLALLYAAGTWMLSARLLIVQAVRFRAEMVYWAQMELHSHGNPPTEALAQQLLNEHRDVAHEEFAADFRYSKLSPEFVELASRTRTGYGANQSPLEANIRESSIALLCPVTPFWILAVHNAGRAAERAYVEQTVRELETTIDATTDAEKFAAVHDQGRLDAERGLDIIK